MRPSSLHLINRDERARSLSGVSVRLEDYISDVYEHLADVSTKRILKALRHGVTLTGVQETIRATEWMTSISPNDSVPFQSKIWEIHEMQNGTVSLDPKPYRVIGARTMTNSKIEAGRTPSMEEVLIENTRWVDTTYNRAAGEIVGINDDSDYSGQVWVVEQRFQNPAIKSYFSNSHSVTLSDLGPDYPPPHLFYLTRLLETVRQNGARPNQLFWAAQAVFGAPFAYAGGTIQYYDSGLYAFNDVQFNEQEGDTVTISPDVTGSFTSAIIETDDGEWTASFLPHAATGDETELKEPGTEVQKHEPLIKRGNTSSFSMGVNRSFEDPIPVDSTDRVSDTITLSASSHGLESKDRAMLQVLNQEYSTLVVVESVSGADVTVRGEIGKVQPSDWAYLSPLSTTATGGGTASISVDSPYTNGDIDLVNDVVDKASPPNVAYSVSIA